MSKIAVIKSGGKQYKVKEGQTVKLEKIDKKEGDIVAFDTLLTATTDGKEVNIGKPGLGEKTEGKIVEQGKDKKISVIKFKSKTRYLRNKGHRQLFSKVEIQKIA
ncbi:50S ribosomal protein L21 [Candidatus Parcubacteria bacterium]|nr:50S ribosomal protein L21 [Candidatus Parcubacteria bacterium]